MSRTLRVDRGALRAPRRKANGTLVADGVFSRVGVFTYMNTDGSLRRELRLPEEVFHADALASLEAMPVVNDHPPPGVSVDRASARGLTQEGVGRDGDFVVGSVIIHDSHLIDVIESGKTALSVGYGVDYDPTPGVHPVYGKYDGIQRNIRGDHLAVVDRGRAGPEARLRMDAAGRCDYVEQRGGKWVVLSMSGEVLGEHETEEEARRQLAAMESSKKDSAQVLHAAPNSVILSHVSRSSVPMDELKKQLAAAVEQIAAITARADRADQALASEKERADKAEGALAALKPELDALKQARKDEEDPAKLQAQINVLQSQVRSEKERADKASDPERFNSAVRRRARIERRSTCVLGPTVRVDSLSERDLMVASLEKLGKLPEGERSDEYIEAMFETAVDSYLAGAKALDEITVAVRADAPPSISSAHKAREEMIKRNRSCGEVK